MKYDPHIIMDEDNSAYKALLGLAIRKDKASLINKIFRRQKEPLYCWYGHCEELFIGTNVFRVRCFICKAKMYCYRPKSWGYLPEEEYHALIRHGMFHLKEHNLLALI